MKTWIALLRGINVGGRNRLPMGSLSSIVEAAGGCDVKTYIQSGNVVFKAAIGRRNDFADRVARAIEKAHGFRPSVCLIPAETLDEAIAANPYPQAVTDPKSLHLFFLDRQPDEAGLERGESLLSESEAFQMIGQCLYLHAPDGIGRSKFVKGVDDALGARTTARNWRTVTSIAELAAEFD